MSEHNLGINFIPADSALNWDEYFMLQALMASFKSKDPATKVGAVFVDQNNHQLTMGYNGFVAGIDEKKLPWGKDKSVPLEYQKYAYVVHAEANAILHSPSKLTNSRLYVTLFPCHECAKLLASSRIKEVIYLQNKNEGSESHRISMKILDLAGIEVRSLKISESLIDKLHQHLMSSLI